MNQVPTAPSRPYTFSFDSKVPWSSVSNAFLRSKKITALTRPWSILHAQLFVVSRSAVTVECKLRNPDWLLHSKLLSVIKE